MKLVGQFHSVAVIAISMFTVVVATLAVNIAANVCVAGQRLCQRVSQVDFLPHRRPHHGIIGILMQPWRLLADPSGYIFAWLVGYSGGLGSIAGVLIADYWIIRKKRLALPDLYLTRV
jgi:NCS1 family nucleobase:cation symporter-1